MWETYPFVPNFCRTHWFRSTRVGNGSSPETPSNVGGTRNPASPRNRLKASPCQSSS